MWRVKTIHQISLICQTVKYLKMSQIFYQIWYRLKSNHPITKTYLFKIEKIKPPSFLPFLRKGESLRNNVFTFLNCSKAYSLLSTINWDENAYGKLWAYNLNYFDFLNQSGVQANVCKSLIVDFINKYPSLKIAKEPYTISLRGINWIKWISSNKIEDVQFLNLFNRCLYDQYQRLVNNLEYHLKGNHLLENSFSLLFGAFYFSNHLLYNKAYKLLKNELNEQVLNDGAHFELSTMYHQIMLDRALDCINLLQNNHQFANQNELYSLLCSKVPAMLGWLQQMTFSNGDIPLVNDTAISIAPTTSELELYAKTLGIKSLKLPLKDCGYRMFHGNDFELLVDYGVPGPNYIPGHAHADIFSFILYVHGKPLIVDTGTSTYDAGKIRSFERSTAAHNTVKVNGIEQSETWGAFRMGRRTNPIITSDTSESVAGYHTGFKPNTHLREFVKGENSFRIIDNVLGPDHNAIAYLHFTPDTKIDIIKDTIICDHCNLKVKGVQRILLDQYEMAYGFNKYSKAPLIKVFFKDQLETIFEFQDSF
jgi:hypothetical protein